jgi:hypothetical protein
MKRRNLTFSLLAVAAMNTAHAQQTGKVTASLWFIPRTRWPHSAKQASTIFTELRRLGYVERKDILIERYSERSCLALFGPGP